MTTLANITGIGMGLKNTEARDVQFIKPDEDPGIETLCISYDAEPKDHKGMFIRAVELGAPAPMVFEQNLLQFFYSQNKIEGASVPTEVKNAQFVYSISVDDDPRMRELFPSIKRAIRRYDANLGGFEDSMQGVRNTFQNMDLILRAPDITEAHNTFKAALLLSAGPSLEKEWETIRAIHKSDRFLIIACDAVVKKALKEKVEPHLIMTTERVPGAEDFLKDVNQSNCILLSTLMAYGPALRNWTGRRAFVIRKDYPAHWYPFKGRRNIWSAPSVAPTSLGVLGLLGIKDVALVGQDLCFGKDGRSHAKLSDDLENVRLEMEHIERARGVEDKERVETYSGESRGTTNAWNVMKGDLTTVKEQWRLNVVATGLEGAVIKDIPYVPLAEWAATHGKRGKFVLPEKNKYEAHDREALKWKRKAAKEFLLNLEDNLEKYGPDEIIELPHFRELCLTSCQRAYVTYLNKRFQRREDRHEFRTLFRAEALSSIREILEILEIER